MTGRILRRLRTGLPWRGRSTGRISVPTRFLAVGAGGAVVAGMVVAGMNQGYPAAKVPMRTGAAWLASNQVGQLTLVDGSAAEVSAQVKVGRPGSSLAAMQDGSTGYVLNRSDGSLVRVDGATLGTVRRDGLLSASSGEMQAAVGPDSLYAVDDRRGTLAIVDPKTLVPRGQPVDLPARMATDQPVVDAGGRLWMLDPGTGDLAWYSSGKLRVRGGAGTPGRSVLSLVDGRPVLVDQQRRQVQEIDPDSGARGRRLAIDLRPEDTVAVSGSPDGDRLYVVVNSRRALIVCSFGARSCGTSVQLGTPLPGGPAGPGLQVPPSATVAPAELGAPVEARSRVLVPDFATGQVWIVDPATMKVVAQPYVFASGQRFELLARDGLAFFNDPDGDQAGVIDPDGRVHRVRKYAGSEPGAGTGGPGTGGQIGKPGNEPPGFPPLNPILPQPPAVGASGRDGIVSIVVRPGLRGPVGQRFDFSLAPQGGAVIASATWTFGDGTGAAGRSAQHRWQRAGTFRVVAKAALADGRRATATVAIAVGSAAGAVPDITRITVSPAKPKVGQPVRFSAAVAGAAPQRWAWTVVRLPARTRVTTSTAPQFTHKFGTAGEYRVSLVASTAAGSDGASANLAVAPAQTVKCGATITKNTVLSEDLKCGGNALTIGASGVTLNLNGHTISGPRAGSGISVDGTAGTPVSNVTIRNGTITKFSTGIDVRNAQTLSIEGVKLVSNVAADGFGGTAVFMDAVQGVEITKCHFTDNMGTIAALSGSGVRVSDSIFVSPTNPDGTRKTPALYVNATSSSITNIAMTGGFITSTAPGFTLSNNKKLINVAVDIQAENATVDRNTISGEALGRPGIAVASSGPGVHITNNTVSGHQSGLDLLLNDAVTGMQINGNTFFNNDAAGISVTAFGSAEAAQVDIADNILTGNGQRGMSDPFGQVVDDGLHFALAERLARGVVVARNHTSGNKEYGIEAVIGSITDGHDNTATEAQGCLGVVCTPPPG